MHVSPPFRLPGEGVRPVVRPSEVAEDAAQARGASGEPEAPIAIPSRGRSTIVLNFNPAHRYRRPGRWPRRARGAALAVMIHCRELGAPIGNRSTRS
jgi:hypothetical protein